jgi:hypothetical protein
MSKIDQVIKVRANKSQVDIDEPMFRDPFEHALNRWLRAAEDVSKHREALTIYYETLEPWLTTLVGKAALSVEGTSEGTEGYTRLERYFYDCVDSFTRSKRLRSLHG